MNFPYSKKKWMSISLAAVLTTALGAGSLTASANTGSDQTKAPATVQASNDKTITQTGTGSQSTPEATTGEELTLEKAVEQALKTNAALNEIRLDAKNADLNQSLTYVSNSDLPSDAIASLEAAQQKYYNNAKGAQAKKLNALYVKSAESKTKLGAQDVYYKLIFAQDDLNLKKQSLARSEAQLKVAKAAFDVGTNAKTDVLEAEMGVAAAKAELKTAENNLEIARMNLNDFLGVDLTKEWKHISSNKQTAPIKMTLKEAEEKALSNRNEITQAQEELKLAELNVKLISDFTAASTLQGQMARNGVEKANLEIEKQKRAVTKDVTEAYLNLNAAREAIDFSKSAKDSAAESYRLKNLRFENGLATTLDVIQSEEALSKSENQYQKAVLTYNLAVVAFETALGN
ncbi:TolC family protein [Brevibacillus porteri]|uniref:TolC family protein n=1 Tax=Brevibacillus porteri TaxID=2126350 RepID=A0ABX5FK02_9BACL|nr:TolC family protein [Brevibacillus porteri]MED1798194.1 TolC family protein [Brevibacillus porteri]MED2133875.1 TolC family protein [Brevibacillus porteri]MED2743247.1 TolC family protein [Brevibacillus porteri]MED2815419.1 TolC family protein [Brevibacillus porteri]MED2892193.1 TolC family protein [Brevibacillus porteri]